MSYCLSFGDGQHSSIVMQEMCSVMILSSSSAVSQNNHLTDGYEQTHIHIRTKIVACHFECIQFLRFQNRRFSKSPILKIFLQKFHRLVLGLVGLIDAKAINVAQPIWS